MLYKFMFTHFLYFILIQGVKAVGYEKLPLFLKKK